jgi:hypothetical protein
MNHDPQQFAIWRGKVLDNTITEEELTAAILALRAGRKGAAIASEKTRKAKVKAAVPTAEDLLSEMEGL